MKNFELRLPQKEAVESFFDYYKNGKGLNPIICMFTGLGKSYTIAEIIIRMLKKNSKMKLIVVTHSEKVLTQDCKALYDLLSYYNVFATIGIYSAKLKRKETDKQITFATINSIYKVTEKFNPKYVIIDECHLVSDREDTMYRKMLSDFGTKVCGFTATPFRMKKGYIHEMEGAVFTDLIYNTNTPENFLKMIELGYLVKPVRKPIPLESEMQTKGIAKTGGDFNLKGLSLALDREELTRKICQDMLKYKDERKHWFVFCIDKKHSENTSRILNELGIKSDYVHSSKEEDNDIAINKFKNDEIQAICSVMMLTTGVDIPKIDTIGILRPTDSVVIHVQLIGRGLRACKETGKTDCLVLDYAGNTARNGPIDDPIIKVAGKGRKGGVIEKECPKCKLKHHISVRFCECGYEFTFKEKLELESSEHSLIREKVKVWKKVDDVTYYVHKKIGKPESLRIDYLSGFRVFSLWLTLFHGGRAQKNAEFILRRLKKQDIKYTCIKDIINQSHLLKVPKKIYVDVTDKHPFIEDFEFEENK